MNEESIWCPTWHQVNKVSRSIRHCIRAIEEVGFDTKIRTMQIKAIKLSLALIYYIAMVGFPLPNILMLSKLAASGQFLDLMVQRSMTYLSKYGHIISIFGILGCFNSLGGSIDTQSSKILEFCGRYVNPSSDHLNVLLLKYDGKDQTSIF